MKIAFQGAKGAYSDMACHQLFPKAKTIPCLSFDLAFETLKNGNADLAVIPIENTLAGRVADVHHLLPTSDLHIIGEYFLPIRHCLLGIKDTKLHDITNVHSHVHALPQCRDFIKKHKLTSHVHADTAGAAQKIANDKNKSQGAIASSLAAKIYDLDILASDIQDDDTNKTRFIILSKTPATTNNIDDLMTSFVFEVKNIPAALYKALGGFATNGVNMMKLESYVDDKFNAARFYCEVMGSPNDNSFNNAINELDAFAKNIKILGSYPISPLRQKF